MSKLYGIDLDKKITPLMVRNALVNCFYEAHQKDTGVSASGENVIEYCKEIVIKAFEEVGGSFENPTKKDIIAVVEKLQEFSKGFRDRKTIEKNAKEIMLLVNKID